jgi:O-acetyl-ADP-ribose deacetylase (regulator of RNase III)
MEFSLGDTRIYLIQGDITQIAADAIVNAANSSLMGGGGVDGAIHRAGGPEILTQCERIVARQGELPAGEVVATTGGNMPARHVIHTVGPIWDGGASGEAELLASCYAKSLALAVELDLDSIAFPAISTGVYGYPSDEACRVAFASTRAFCDEQPGALGEISFVYFAPGALIEAEGILRIMLEAGGDA